MLRIMKQSTTINQQPKRSDPFWESTGVMKHERSKILNRTILEAPSFYKDATLRGSTGVAYHETINDHQPTTKKKRPFLGVDRCYETCKDQDPKQNDTQCSSFFKDATLRGSTGVAKHQTTNDHQPSTNDHQPNYRLIH